MQLGLGLSLASGSVVASGPTNTVAPAISGTIEEGQELTCSQGTWIGTGTISYAYQWRRNNVGIPGETSSTYTIVSADAGALLSCSVTATDDEGSSVALAIAASAVPSGPVTAAPGAATDSPAAGAPEASTGAAASPGAATDSPTPGTPTASGGGSSASAAPGGATDTPTAGTPTATADDAPTQDAPSYDEETTTLTVTGSTDATRAHWAIYSSGSPADAAAIVAGTGADASGDFALDAGSGEATISTDGHGGSTVWTVLEDALGQYSGLQSFDLPIGATAAPGAATDAPTVGTPGASAGASASPGAAQDAPTAGTPTASAGGGATLVTDDFNRADSNGLGSNWTDLRDQWDVVSNEARQPTAGVSTTSVYTGATFAANQYAMCTVTSITAGGGVGVVLRATDGSNFLYAYVNNVSWRIFKKVAGSDTQIGSTGTATLSASDVIYLEVDSDTVTLRKGGPAGAVQATGSLGGDLSAAGHPGLNTYWTGSGGFGVDDFEAGDL